MALNTTYFEPKKVYEPLPVPETPGYVPPVVPTPPSPDPGSVPSITPPVLTGTVSVQFYVNSSDDDTMDKNLTAVGSEKSVVIKDKVNLLDFEIPFNDTSISGVNYAKVKDRYYYCVPVLDHGNLTGIHFKVDALMSHKDKIRRLNAIVDRTGSNFNTYLPDSNMKITAYTTTHTIQSTAGFSQEQKYYLLTIGDKGVTP